MAASIALRTIPGTEQTAAPIRQDHKRADALDRTFRTLHAERPDVQALQLCLTPLEVAKLPTLCQAVYVLADRAGRGLPVRNTAEWAYAVDLLDREIALNADAAPASAPPTPRGGLFAGAKVLKLHCGCRVTVLADGVPHSIHQGCGAISGYYNRYLAALEAGDKAEMQRWQVARWDHVQVGLIHLEGAGK
jgi:hypothetical protein